MSNKVIFCAYIIIAVILGGLCGLMVNGDGTAHTLTHVGLQDDDDDDDEEEENDSSLVAAAIIMWMM